jgi:uncharacterized membrane protein YhaH (DUF805 family)
MSFDQAVRSGFANYANFSGRASRSAYWWWALFALIIGAVARGLDTWLGLGGLATSLGTFGPISAVAGLALILPNWAAFTRRLHDTDRSGWWWLLMLLPLIGWIVLIYFLASAGTPGPNRYGPPPRDALSVGSVPADGSEMVSPVQRT